MQSSVSLIECLTHLDTEGRVKQTYEAGLEQISGMEIDAKTELIQ